MTHQPPNAPILYSFPDNGELVDSVAEFVLKAQNDAIKKRGAFTLAISGGSLPANLKGLIGKEGVLFDKWCVSLSSNPPLGLTLAPRREATGQLVQPDPSH